MTFRRLRWHREVALMWGTSCCWGWAGLLSPACCDSQRALCATRPRANGPRSMSWEGRFSSKILALVFCLLILCRATGESLVIKPCFVLQHLSLQPWLCFLARHRSRTHTPLTSFGLSPPPDEIAPPADCDRWLNTSLCCIKPQTEYSWVLGFSRPWHDSLQQVLGIA